MVVGIVLALVLLALLFGLSREPVYTAEAVVKIEPRERLVSDQEKEAFVEEVRGAVVATDGFIQDVMRRAGWEAATTDFKDRLDFETVTQGDETGMLVRFSGSDPEQPPARRTRTPGSSWRGSSGSTRTGSLGERWPRTR